MALTTANDTNIITETVFENRFMHVDELKGWGISRGRTYGRHEVPRLTGISHRRAGASLVIAGLMAEGETEIAGVHHIDRYENLVSKLNAVAKIKWYRREAERKPEKFLPPGVTPGVVSEYFESFPSLAIHSVLAETHVIAFGEKTTRSPPAASCSRRKET